MPSIAFCKEDNIDQQGSFEALHNTVDLERTRLVPMNIIHSDAGAEPREPDAAGAGAAGPRDNDNDNSSLQPLDHGVAGLSTLATERLAMDDSHSTNTFTVWWVHPV